MLISMPTATSAIFGVFQAMIVSSKKLKPTPDAGVTPQTGGPPHLNG
jgi:hypothetical protein